MSDPQELASLRRVLPGAGRVGSQPYARASALVVAPISVLSPLRSAAHRLDLGEDAWVGALGSSARPLIDDGLGVFAYGHRLGGERIHLGAVAACGAPDGMWGALSRWGATHEATIAAVYRRHPPGVWTLSGQARGALPRFDPPSWLDDHGARDLWTIVAQTTSGDGVVLTAPRRRPRALTPVERRAFASLAGEIAAAVVLRRARRAVERNAAFSPAERRVADLLVRGRSDKEIAADLGMAMSTVSTLATRLRTKLGCGPGQETLRLASPDAPLALARRCAAFERLSAAESAIAAELLTGASYDDIARRRGSTIRTVAAQSASVFRKVGVSGRRQLAATLLGGRGRASS